MVLLIVTAFFATTGCVALLGAGAGAGTFAYIKGNLETTYDATMAQTWDATREALQQMGMTADIDRHDAFSGSLKGTMADGKEFNVVVTRVTDTRTEVAIRIGLGDKKISEAIHDKIAANLKA
jgi:hypothetical protein